MREGDYFAIPMEDGRSAVSQIIWLGSNSKDQKFKNIFAFSVLSVGNGRDVIGRSEYLQFEGYRGPFVVLFTAIDKLKSREWPTLKSGIIAGGSLKEFEFNMAGTLYRQGHPVRVLPIEEYQNYLVMAVSGYALVEKFLQQY
ncbi:hypothetical protein TZ03_27285 [Pseudomonas sp. 10-1B]|nr:hypothetical protein TZ03_27285 [Pseudomonas sp. 10-1B]